MADKDPDVIRHMVCLTKGETKKSERFEPNHTLLSLFLNAPLHKQPQNLKRKA